MLEQVKLEKYDMWSNEDVIDLVEYIMYPPESSFEQVTFYKSPYKLLSPEIK